MLNKKILQRKNIQKELLNFLEYPLTILTAPMGYGKTTIALEFLKSNDIDYRWFSFEVEEKSPKFIWDTFSRQLKSINLEVGNFFQNIGFPFTTPQRNQIVTILNSITKVKPIYMVVDDYQFNKSKEIDAFLELLIRVDIPELKILILSRSIPNINIAELTLKNKCYCIPEKEFLLSLSEVGKLYRINKVPADKAVIEKTYKISEGWISAALLLIQRYSVTGKIDSIKYIEELIGNTIMDKYSGGREEIAVLGIFDNFSVEQLEYVLGKDKANILLDKLSNEGTFIRYDQIRSRYIIHNIFQKYLFDYEFVKLPLEKQKKYYLKAGKWFVENNYIMEGINHFLSIKEYELILKEFEKKSIRKVFDYYPEVVNDIMKQIPRDIKYKYPLAYLCYLHFLISAQDVQYGAKLLIEMDMKFKNGEISVDSGKLKLDGEMEFLKSLIAYNDVDKLFKKQRDAYKIIGGKSETTRPDKMPCSGSFSILYMYYKSEGSMKEVAEIIRNNIKYYEILSDRVGTGIEFAIMAEYYLEIGDIEKAYIYAKKTILKSEKLPQYDVVILGTFILARCEIAKGNIKESLKLMDGLTNGKSMEVSSLLYSIRSPYFFAMDAIKIRTCNFNDVSESLKNKDLNNKRLFFQSKGLGYILYGQVLLYEKKYIELEVHCEEMNKLFYPFNNLIGYIHSYILESISALHLYGIERATYILLKALNIARKDCIVTSIAEYGGALLPVLEKLVINESDLYMNLLIAKTRMYDKHIKCYQSEEKCIKFTPRESEVMELLITGISNSSIGSELFISESAVKKTLYFIYKKLGVESRTAAIKAYQDRE